MSTIRPPHGSYAALEAIGFSSSPWCLDCDHGVDEGAVCTICGGTGWSFASLLAAYTDLSKRYDALNATVSPEARR